jgi:hypothetical protein
LLGVVVGASTRGALCPRSIIYDRDKVRQVVLVLELNIKKRRKKLAQTFVLAVFSGPLDVWYWRPKEVHADVDVDGVVDCLGGEKRLQMLASRSIAFFFFSSSDSVSFFKNPTTRSINPSPSFGSFRSE